MMPYRARVYIWSVKHCKSSFEFSDLKCQFSCSQQRAAVIKYWWAFPLSLWCSVSEGIPTYCLWWIHSQHVIQTLYIFLYQIFSTVFQDSFWLKVSKCKTANSQHKILFLHVESKHWIRCSFLRIQKPHMRTVLTGTVVV